MSDEEDFVEGDAGSAEADAPGEVPVDDAPLKREADGVADSASGNALPFRKGARNAAMRKAFAEAIVANKKAAPPVAEQDVLDPDDDAPPAAAAAAAPKPAEAPPKPAEPAKAPPAPSLDPEVRQLRDQLKADRAKFDAERAEWEKQKTPPPAPAADPVAMIEDYIDSPPRAYRSWLESMRGDKISDDDYKTEVKEFITLLSNDVLGVPLPEHVRAQLDATLARKAVATSRQIQSKRDAAAKAKAEQERKAAEEKAAEEAVEREWVQASSVINQQFAPRNGVDGKPQESEAAKEYPWLAAEDEPGKIIVDVIRAAANRDGTQLTWQEASKQANGYLAGQYRSAYGKRKALFEPPAAAAPPPVAKPKAPPPPVAPPPAVKPDGKWNREKHLENTKAAFRAMLTKQE